VYDCRHENHVVQFRGAACARTSRPRVEGSALDPPLFEKAGKNFSTAQVLSAPIESLCFPFGIYEQVFVPLRENTKDKMHSRLCASTTRLCVLSFSFSRSREKQRLARQTAKMRRTVSIRNQEECVSPRLFSSVKMRRHYRII